MAYHQYYDSFLQQTRNKYIDGQIAINKQKVVSDVNSGNNEAQSIGNPINESIKVLGNSKYLQADNNSANNPKSKTNISIPFSNKRFLQHIIIVNYIFLIKKILRIRKFTSNTIKHKRKKSLYRFM